MANSLSAAQKRAVLQMSNRGGGRSRMIEQSTLHSLERARIVFHTGERWRLTDAGKMLAAALREADPLYGLGENTIPRVRQAVNACYTLLVRSHCHAAIEFNGLMQKYVDLLERAEVAGVDWQHLNIHTGRAFEVHTHDLAYLAEKLRCIFGVMLRTNPEARRVFIDTLMQDPNAS